MYIKLFPYGLVPHLGNVELRIQSKKMQERKIFKRKENDLERMCCETDGLFYKVVYTGPSETELWTETKVRRQRMRRKLLKYYQFKLEQRQYINLTIRPLTNRFLDGIASDFYNESQVIECPSGDYLEKCMCRGVNQDHICFWGGGHWKMRKRRGEFSLGSTAQGAGIDTTRMSLG